jgi:hypothetical protein
MMIEIRRPVWVGCALAFLALCKVGFCASALCAFQCAKNSVGQSSNVIKSNFTERIKKRF